MPRAPLSSCLGINKQVRGDKLECQSLPQKPEDLLDLSLKYNKGKKIAVCSFPVHRPHESMAHRVILARWNRRQNNGHHHIAANRQKNKNIRKRTPISAQNYMQSRRRRNSLMGLYKTCNFRLYCRVSSSYSIQLFPSIQSLFL